MPLTHGANRQIQPVIDLAFRERHRQRSRDVWERKQRLRNNAVIIFKPLEYLFPTGTKPEALFMGARQSSAAAETSAKWMALPNEGYDFGYVVPPSRSSARSRGLSSIPESLPFGPFPKDERTSTSSPPLSTRHTKSTSPRHSLDPSSSSRATTSPPRHVSASNSRIGPLTRQQNHQGTSSARPDRSGSSHTRPRRQLQKHQGTPSPPKAAMPSEPERARKKELQASSKQLAMEQGGGQYCQKESYRHGGATPYTPEGQSRRGEVYRTKEPYPQRCAPYTPEGQSHRGEVYRQSNHQASMGDHVRQQPHYDGCYAYAQSSSSQLPYTGGGPPLLSARQQLGKPVVLGHADASSEHPYSAVGSLHYPKAVAQQPYIPASPHRLPGGYGAENHHSRQQEYHAPYGPIPRSSSPRNVHHAARTPNTHPSAPPSYPHAAPPTSVVASPPRAPSYSASPSPPQSERAANIHPHPHDMLYEYAEKSSVGIRRRHPEYENIPTPHIRKTVSVCVPRDARRCADPPSMSAAAHAVSSSSPCAAYEDADFADGRAQTYKSGDRGRGRERSGSTNPPHGDNSSKSPDSSVSRAVWAYDKPNVKRINGVLYTSRAHGHGAHTWVTTNDSYGKYVRDSPSSSPFSGGERGGRG